MRLITGFFLGIIAVIAGFYLLIYAAFGSNDIMTLFMLGVTVVIFVVLVRLLIGKSPKSNIQSIQSTQASENNYIDKEVLFKEQEKHHNKINNIGYGFGFAIMSVYLNYCIQEYLLNDKLLYLALFAPVFMINVAGVVWVQLYMRKNTPSILGQANETKPKNPINPTIGVNIVMFVTIIFWIWVTTAVSGIYYDTKENGNTTPSINSGNNVVNDGEVTRKCRIVIFTFDC